MKSAWLVALMAPLVWCAPAQAQVSAESLAVAESLRDQALAGSGAYDIVESLTTEVGPRMAGTDADARAVAWAVAKFKAMGFDTVYTEPVSFPVWRRTHERAEVISPFPQPIHLTALGRSVGTGDQPIEAEVVEFATLEALQAAPVGSLQGKIAYVSNRMTRARDGSGYGPAVAARGKGAPIAAERGAVAYLIRSIGTDNDRLPHTGMMSYDESIQAIPAAALSNPDADLLSNMLKRGVPVTMRLDIAADMGEEYVSHNVIAEVRGRESPEEVVVLAAHLDSWDMGTGAIDDGAGIAITAQAAAMIAALPERPRRTIRVIAFANEEQGLIGGKAYAAAHQDAISQHIIGAESDFGAGRIYAFSTSQVTDENRALILQLADTLKPLGIEYTPGKGGAGPDLIPIVQRGMAWAWLGQDGTDYFDYHHTHNDTLDKIDPKALDQNVAAYAVFAWLTAESTVKFGSQAISK